MFLSENETRLFFRLASLLPPAVNSGLLFAYAILVSSFSNIGAIDFSSSTIKNSTGCPSFISNAYIPLYTCNLANEAAILAAASLLLTFVNIICIILMALLILRIKEVVPLHQPNKEIAEFFHHDVKVARDYNRTIQHESEGESSIQRKQLTQTILAQWRRYTLPENRPTEPIAESKPKLIRLRSFAKEFDLDPMEKRHADLLERQYEEKVRFLVNDLIDLSKEMPNVSLDLSRLQPATVSGTTSNDEHRLFVRELIEALPTKWFQIYKDEEQKRKLDGTRFRLTKLSSIGGEISEIF